MNTKTIVLIDCGNPHAVRTVAGTSRNFIIREDIHGTYSDNVPGFAGQLYVRRTYRYCFATRSIEGELSYEFVIRDPSASNQFIPAPPEMLAGLEFEINEASTGKHTSICVRASVERRAMFADQPERGLHCCCVNQGCEVVRAPDGSFDYIPYRQTVAV